ncbi:MAG: hypothetical protein ACQJCO_01335 [cyanobacterium endosymbiont of Rhopalodia sterrenbergii]
MSWEDVMDHQQWGGRRRELPFIQKGTYKQFAQQFIHETNLKQWEYLRYSPK